MNSRTKYQVVPTSLKHYRELEKRNRTFFSPFHDETTENMQLLQKSLFGQKYMISALINN